MGNAIGMWELFLVVTVVALFWVFVRVFFPGATFFRRREGHEGGGRVERLERLARLRTDGSLTEEEFQREKHRILDDGVGGFYGLAVLVTLIVGLGLLSRWTDFDGRVRDVTATDWWGWVPWLLLIVFWMVIVRQFRRGRKGANGS